jgi:hypothetical protein
MFRMPGRKDHRQLRIGLEQARPGLKQRGFFAFERAAGNDEAQIASYNLEQTGCVGFFGSPYIKFEIAGDRDTLRQTADGYEAIGVGLALGKDSAESAKEGPP